MSAWFSALKSRSGPDSQGLPSIECEVEGANDHSRHCQGGCRHVRIDQLAGVGKIDEEKLAKLGIKTVGELRSLDRANLEREFGSHGEGCHLRGVRRRQTRSSQNLARPVRDLYFEPKYEGFRPRTIWSLSNAFTSAFKDLEPIPQFRPTAKLGELPEARFSQSF
jgi:hypothetical protein